MTGARQAARHSALQAEMNERGSSYVSESEREPECKPGYESERQRPERQLPEQFRPQQPHRRPRSEGRP